MTNAGGKFATVTGARFRKLRSLLGVGALGFLIDAAVFFSLTQVVALGYGWARFSATFVAVNATWLLNRASTFAEGRVESAPIQWLRYLAASLVGAALFAIDVAGHAPMA